MTLWDEKTAFKIGGIPSTIRMDGTDDLHQFADARFYFGSIGNRAVRQIRQLVPVNVLEPVPDTQPIHHQR